MDEVVDAWVRVPKILLAQTMSLAPMEATTKGIASNESPVVLPFPAPQAISPLPLDPTLTQLPGPLQVTTL